MDDVRIRCLQDLDHLGIEGDSFLFEEVGLLFSADHVGEPVAAGALEVCVFSPQLSLPY